MFIVARVKDDRRIIDAVYTEGTFTGPGSSCNDPMIVAHILVGHIEDVCVFYHPVLNDKTVNGLEDWVKCVLHVKENEVV